MTFCSGCLSGEIIKSITGQVWGNCVSDKSIKHLLIDSRTIVVPELSIFFAIVTENNNGHKYINELYTRGVRFFVISENPKLFSEQNPDACFICVEDTLSALQQLAAHHRKKYSCPIIAITGSNGKTIIKEWLFQILNDQQKIVRSPKSYNSQIGVPLSVWQLDSEYELGIFEAGISTTGEMEKLQNILKPDYGIFTNIGPAHDEGFSNNREKIQEKLKLFVGVKKLIYCADYEELHQEINLWAKSNADVELCPWSKENNRFPTYVSKIQKTKEGQNVELNHNSSIIRFSLSFFDEISLENALHCVAYLCNMGYSQEFIVNRIHTLQPVAMRMEMRQGINQCSVINDTYNSDLHSLSIALDFLSAQVQHPKKRLIISDILQTGISEERLYEQVSVLVNSKSINQIIGIGPAINRQASKFDIPIDLFPDTESFLKNFKLADLFNEAILIKGSRPFGFERISNLLQQKDHQTILEINLDALAHNLKVYKSIMSPKTMVMAMVKAFSYGSGSYEIASLLSRHNCNYLAVAYADEGKELRNNGITLPIMVMNPEIQSMDILHYYKLQPEIYSIALFEKIARSAKLFDGISESNPFPIHIKLDTGMHRLGFLQNEINQLTELANENKHIKVISVFSHLAASDMPQYDDFTKSQVNLFIEMTNTIEQQIGYKVIKHICNSSAISRFPEAHFDMVRLGIGLYGFDNYDKISGLLKNVSSFKSIVSQIKIIKKGDSIGYSRAKIADKEIKIAIVPVGYADGLSRKLGNGNGSLMINGKLAPTIGNISMDMCTLDITNLDANEGDDVIIFNDELPLTHLAKDLETIPYEVLTSVSHRVKRVYFRE
jgi:Alr-MurF fusion protein